MVKAYQRLLMLTTMLFVCGVSASDPTRPEGWQPTAAAEAKTASALTLNQIIAFNGKTFAIINGKRYQEKDTIENYRVIAIEAHRVLLQNGEQEIELMMYSRNIKHRSSTQGGEQ